MSLDAQYLEIHDMLSRCHKLVSRDYAFGDEEIMWIDDDYNIVAEAYLSPKIVDFWTCPPGTWVYLGIDERLNEPCWQPGDNPTSEPVHYTGSLAIDLIKTFKSIKVNRNDSGN